MSEQSKRRMRRIGAGVGVGAGVAGALLALGLLSLTGSPPTGAGAPGWVKEIVTGLGQRGYDWIAIDVSGPVATVSGAAPDVDSQRYGFEAAETEILRAEDAAVTLVVDATNLEGGAEGVGAAFAALSATPAAEDCQAAFRRTLDGRIINFAPDSATLAEDNKRLLDTLAAVAARCQAFRIEIGGHTDASGNPAANNRLSEARATAVRDYLVSRGTPPDGLTAQGYGSRAPLDTARTPAADAKNRRIEFTVSAN